MISVFVHLNGDTQRVERLDPAWLEPRSGAVVWADITEPTAEDGKVLSDVFHFHPLAIEDALSAIQFPKIETYDRYLYLILHGIDYQARHERFATRDVDFFLGSNYLVTIHEGVSRSVNRVREICERHAHALAEGPVAVLHRIVDGMVDNYGPEMDELEQRITQLEEQAFVGRDSIIRSLLGTKRDLATLRRIVIPQRDAVGRLARREFAVISDEMAYRFRDVFDHLVRITDETLIFQDRVTGILEAHLSVVSNRLNEIMKVLTVMSTIFLPLTVLTGMWGMNIRLPIFPGDANSQFWWIVALMLGLVFAMLVAFRRKRWI